MSDARYGLVLPRIFVAVLGLASLAAAATAQEPAAAAAPVVARAFTITGVVRDTAGRPLEGAEARVDSGRVSLSGPDGTFTIFGVTGMPARVRIRRLGFEAAELNVSPPVDGERVNVAVTLIPNSVQLGTIVVEGRALDTRLWNAGFYKRARLGVGRFIGPDELEHFAGGLATVLRETPRIIMDHRNNEDYAYARAGSHTCRMNVFVDGQFARYANPGVSGRGDQGVGVNAIVPRDDIRAVEIYPSLTSVPSQFLRIGPAPNQTSDGRAGRIPAAGSSPRQAEEEGPSDAACGAIVIWTRWYAARGMLAPA